MKDTSKTINMKKKKIGLLLQIVIAIAAGILAGMIPSWFSVTDPAINIVVRLTIPSRISSASCSAS